MIVKKNIVRFVEGDPTPETPHPPHPDAPTPEPDKPPEPTVETAPKETQSDDLHRSLAALTQTVAELQGQVAGIIADGQPVQKTDPTPAKRPWTHRRFGKS